MWKGIAVYFGVALFAIALPTGKPLVHAQDILVANSPRSNVQVADAETIPIGYDCDNPKTFAVANMCNGQKANNVAAAGAIFSFVVMMTAFWSLAYAKKSADASQISAEAGQMSAQAAIKAAESAGDMMKADRAWLTVGVPEVHWSGFLDPAGQPIDFFIRTLLVVKNTGRSPAINIRSAGGVTWTPPGASFQPEDLTEVLSSGHVLGVGETFVITPKDADELTALLVVAGKADMYVNMLVIYDDVFGGKDHSTKCCFKVAAQVGRKPDGTGTLFNQMTAVPGFNYVC